MTYTATLYYTETKTKTAQVEANNRNEAHDKLMQRRELVGFECYKLEKEHDIRRETPGGF